MILKADFAAEQRLGNPTSTYFITNVLLFSQNSGIFQLNYKRK